MGFDVDYLMAQVPALLRGLEMTVKVSLISIGLSVLIGILGAACRGLKIPILSQMTALYVEFIRNTPLLAQLFFIFFGLPEVGVKLSAFWSGVACLSIWGGAYQIENIRGGLESVSRGMREAALSLGLRPSLFFFLVALPLAIRVCLPAALNNAISILKNSAYLQVIGLAELTYVALDRVSMDFRIFEMFATILFVYLGLVLILSFAASRLEARLHRPFLA